MEVPHDDRALPVLGGEAVIRAKVTSTSSSRDDALTYLYNQLASKDWADWKRAGDITLVQRRQQFKAPVWLATAPMVRDEDFR